MVYNEVEYTLPDGKRVRIPLADDNKQGRHVLADYALHLAVRLHGTVTGNRITREVSE